MGANEVLEHVKALPPRERRKFFARVHELETALEIEPAARRNRPIRWPDAAARRRRILATRFCQFGFAGAGTGALLAPHEPLRGHQPAHLVLHQ